MSIILAIEPDRRQAVRLAGVVRQRVGAELLLAETTEGALDAIGNRVPDLVLVPALLSPQDDAALAAALRVIAAAAHVRTLTIPVLASESKADAPRGGLLGKWRRGRNASAALDGCDPAVFAEQIVAYLAEAAADRAALALAPGDDGDHNASFDDPVVESTVVAMSPIIYDEWCAPEGKAEKPGKVDYVFDEPVEEIKHVGYVFAKPVEVVKHIEYVPTYGTDAHDDDAPPVTTSSFVADVWRAPVDEAEPVAFHEPVAAVHEEEVVADSVIFSDRMLVANADSEDADSGDTAEEARPLAIQDENELDIDLSSELDEISSDEALFDGDVVSVYTVSLELDDVFDDEWNEAVEEVAKAAAAAPVAHAALMSARMEAFVSAPVEDDGFEVEDDVVFAAAEDITAEVAAMQAVVFAPVEGVAATNPEVADGAGDKSWIAEYLTPRCMWPTMEGVHVESAEPAAFEHHVAEAPKAERTEWTELVASLRQDIKRRRVEPAPAKPPLRRVKKAKPVQDEWGFFDPEQCGFSALLAKLDEITDAPDDSDARRP